MSNAWKEVWGRKDLGGGGGGGAGGAVGGGME